MIGGFAVPAHGAVTVSLPLAHRRSMAPQFTVEVETYFGDFWFAFQSPHSFTIGPYPPSLSLTIGL